MAQKKTFGELTEGSYFWSATTGCIHRHKVNYFSKTNYGIAKVGLSWYTIFDIGIYATEYHNGETHLYMDKADAVKKAYELLIEQRDEVNRKLQNIDMQISVFQTKNNIKTI